MSLITLFFFSVIFSVFGQEETETTELEGKIPFQGRLESDGDW